MGRFNRKEEAGVEHVPTSSLEAVRMPRRPPVDSSGGLFANLDLHNSRYFPRTQTRGTERLTSSSSTR